MSPNKDPSVARLLVVFLAGPPFVCQSQEHTTWSFRPTAKWSVSPASAVLKVTCSTSCRAGIKLRAVCSLSKPNCPQLRHLLDSGDSQVFRGR